MDKLKQNSDTADFDLYTYNACYSLPLTHVRKNFNTYYSLKGIYLPNTTGGRATDVSFEAGFCWVKAPYVATWTAHHDRRARASGGKKKLVLRTIKDPLKSACSATTQTTDQRRTQGTPNTLRKI